MYTIKREDCRKYIVHVDDGCVLVLTYKSLTRVINPEVNIELLEGDNIIELPEDGVYQVSIKGQCSNLNETDTRVPLDYTPFRFLYSESNNNAGEIINSVFVNGVQVYDPAVHGVATQGAPNNMLIAVQDWLTNNVNPASIVLLTAPGDDITGFESTFPDTTNYRFSIFGIGVQSFEINIGGTAIQPSRTICYYNASVFTGGPIPGTYNYIVGSTVNGTEVVAPDYYTAAQSEIVGSLIQSELNNIGTQVEINNAFAAIELPNIDDPCPSIDITYVEAELVEESVDVTFYWIEACKLHECVNRRLREWLCCYDPCAEECPLEEQKAKEDLRLFLDLTTHGVYQLIYTYQIGQWHEPPIIGTASYDNVNPIIEIWDEWYKLIEGCGCHPAKPCGCKENTYNDNDCGC